MNAGLKLGTYGLVLVAVLGGGAVVGAVAGPIDIGDDALHDAAHTPEEAPVQSELPAAGLLVSQDGYRFEPESRIVAGGPFAFTITGPDGHAVADYDVLHDRELHFILASRDLQQYAHLHPTRDDHGRWTVDLPDLPAGAYRAFADFEPTGADQLTLGIDLAAPGATTDADPLQSIDTDTIDGFEVKLERAPAGEGHGGTELTITVRREGQVVTTEPYLGAAGHLVALRDGDLAYLHVHPLDDEPNGPVAFAAEVPSAGVYALFFDFQVDGVVHTARFVIEEEGAHGTGH